MAMPPSTQTSSKAPFSLNGHRELIQRLLFLLGALVVFRLGAHIPVPGINPDRLAELFAQNKDTILAMFNMFSGGALERMSILALGIMPYITSSIVFQILTIAFPYFKELQKEGEYGRRKMAQWTRWAAIGLTLLQSIVAAKAFLAPTAALEESFSPSAARSPQAKVARLRSASGRRSWSAATVASAASSSSPFVRASLSSSSASVNLSAILIPPRRSVAAFTPRRPGRSAGDGREGP